MFAELFHSVSCAEDLKKHFFFFGGGGAGVVVLINM